MNRYDSGALRTLLEERGHKWVEHPDNADFIVVNTCAVRQHAENRALSRLSMLASMKKKRKNLLVGIMGCVAQELGEEIVQKIPTIDFIVGTDKMAVVADIADGGVNGKIFTDIDKEFRGIDIPAHIEKGARSAFVTIMRGCDNFCSYCIVPYVRGRERSRSPQKIIAEIKNAVASGIVEITLLGQNVNSYRYDALDFPALLDKIAQISGLQRIRFVTNHPKDFSPKILDTVEKHADKIPPAFHLPLQSGSDKILAAMNRKYTFSQYLRTIEQIYRRFPDAAVTTDIIAGFPGENDDDYSATLAAIDKVRFAGIFAFRYSVRQGTAASHLEDNVPEEIKIARLNEIIRKGIHYAKTYSHNLIGTVQKVLLEGDAPKNPGFLRGIAPSGRIVLFPKNEFADKIVPVKIEKAGTWILWGKI